VTRKPRRPHAPGMFRSPSGEAARLAMYDALRTMQLPASCRAIASRAGVCPASTARHLAELSARGVVVIGEAAGGRSWAVTFPSPATLAPDVARTQACVDLFTHYVACLGLPHMQAAALATTNVLRVRWPARPPDPADSPLVQAVGRVLSRLGLPARAPEPPPAGCKEVDP